MPLKSQNTVIVLKRCWLKDASSHAENFAIREPSLLIFINIVDVPGFVLIRVMS
jgi:hypothetical protein